MKQLTVLFICLYPFLLNAQSILDKPISIKAQNKDINQLLLDISDIADIDIAFKASLFDKPKRVSIHSVNEPLSEVLTECLAGTGVSFVLGETAILLYKPAPKFHQINGYLTDETCGERLVGANIIELQSLEGCASNGYGFFAQTFKRGAIQLQISYLGYQSKTLKLNLTKDQTLQIALKPSLTLQEIVVESKKDSALINSVGTETALPLKWLNFIPKTAGEADVMRYLQLLPGINAGADGFGGLHVRGGNSDQNLILLDDVPVYNPSHTFGLFSIFNADLARSVKLYKGGFPARYGGRTSSVLDVRTKEGNDQQFSGSFKVGTMATSGILELPIVKNKGAVLIAGRKTHINSWLGPLSERAKEKEGTEGEMTYDFYDFNIKAHYSFSDKDKLYLSYYQGKDEFQDETGDPLTIEASEDPNIPPIGNSQENTYITNWGNQIFSLRWNHLYGDKLFSNTTATYSNFDYLGQQTFLLEFVFSGVPIEAIKVQSGFSSVITDYSLRTDFDYFLNNEHTLRFGVKAIKRDFTPGIIEEEIEGFELDSLDQFTENDFDNDKIPTTEISAYFEDEYNKNGLLIKGGVNMSLYYNDDQSYFIPQPRLSASYQLNPKLKTNISATRSSQFLQLLTKTDSGLPNDLWVPTGENTAPQDAWQFTAGLSGNLTEHINWKTEGYWKKLSNLQRLTPGFFDNESTGFLQIDGDNWSEFTQNGEGTSYGVEATLEKQKGTLTGWMSYSWAHANRKFMGAQTVFPFDTRHNITAVANYSITPWLSLSANWLYQSGSPVGENNLSPVDIPFLPILQTNEDAIVDGRLPAYHRLDLNTNLHFQQKRFKHELNLGVYNAYNRKNVAFALSSAINGEVGLNGLPLLPSLSYKVAW